MLELSRRAHPFTSYGNVRGRVFTDVHPTEDLVPQVLTSTVTSEERAESACPSMRSREAFQVSDTIPHRICVDTGRACSLLLTSPLAASQNFEYKMSNILDKPLEVT
jgi:hypothetical protein